MEAIKHTHFNFKGQKKFYQGKVRDVYYFDDKVAMITSDRISAFDHILPRAIPYKGQVLNQIAAHFMKATEDIVPNWILAVPDPNVTIGKIAQPYKVEMVIRAYLTGHAWREYQAGKRVLCGVPLPEGMKENDPFPTPIITPATKADEGHDMDISRQEIIAQGIVAKEDYLQLEHYTRELFARGTKMAKAQGLILVDTKYEFGRVGERIVLIDEIHTPDSSRYFYADGYQERQDNGEKQKQLSKEFVRQWLIENGFQGLEGQVMPTMPDQLVKDITARYIELYEVITGKKFVGRNYENALEDIEANIATHL